MSNERGPESSLAKRSNPVKRVQLLMPRGNWPLSIMTLSRIFKTSFPSGFHYPFSIVFEATWIFKVVVRVFMWMFNWFPAVTKPMLMSRISENEQANMWKTAMKSHLLVSASQENAGVKSHICNHLDRDILKQNPFQEISDWKMDHFH